MQIVQKFPYALTKMSYYLVLWGQILQKFFESVAQENNIYIYFLILILFLLS